MYDAVTQLQSQISQHIVLHVVVDFSGLSDLALDSLDLKRLVSAYFCSLLFSAKSLKQLPNCLSSKSWHFKRLVVLQDAVLSQLYYVHRLRVL